MYLFLVNDFSEYEKTKSVNKNVVAKISHNEYKDILLEKKCLRHLMNRIQSKNHKIGTTAVSNISLFCIDDNIYTLNNVFDILDLVS